MALTWGGDVEAAWDRGSVWRLDLVKRVVDNVFNAVLVAELPLAIEELRGARRVLRPERHLDLEGSQCSSSRQAAGQHTFAAHAAASER